MTPQKHVEEMKELASFLCEYSPPKCPYDEDIAWLKTRDVTIDGVTIIANYSEADHGDLKPSVLTISAKNSVSIPFTITCKLAKMFLGDKNVSLFEYTKEGSKIYSWMVLLKKGVAIENHHIDRGVKEDYNGFQFYRIPMDENTVI